MIKSLLLLVLLILFFNQSSAYYYKFFNIVGPLSTSAFGCIEQLGHTNANIRAYTLDYGQPGSLDPNVLDTMQNAGLAGVGTSVYMEINLPQ